VKYHQCRMKEVDGSRETIGWIEERGAKLGAEVELKEFGAFFKVLSVSEMAYDGDELREKQNRDRNAFASLKA
jgi:hypothetical protein